MKNSELDKLEEFLDIIYLDCLDCKAQADEYKCHIGISIL